MTKVEKYPHSVEALLQREAQSIVRAAWNMYTNSDYVNCNIEVQIKPEIYVSLNARQKKYFYNLFGGVWNIIMPNDRPGVWICVPLEYMACFHYHAPLRVRPRLIHK